MKRTRMMVVGFVTFVWSYACLSLDHLSVKDLRVGRIEAEELVIRDSNGKARIRLATYNKGDSVIIALQDTQATPQVRLGLQYDANDNASLFLNSPDGNSIVLVKCYYRAGTEPEAGLAIQNPGKDSVKVEVIGSPTGPSGLIISDIEGVKKQLLYGK